MRTNKVYNYREFAKILQKNNFEIKRYSGDHTIFVRDRRHVSVARNLNRMICERLIKENNLVLS